MNSAPALCRLSSVILPFLPIANCLYPPLVSQEGRPDPWFSRIGFARFITASLISYSKG